MTILVCTDPIEITHKGADAADAEASGEVDVIPDKGDVAPDKVMEVMPEKVSEVQHHRGKKEGEIFEISLPQNFFDNAPKISGSKIKLLGRTLEKQVDKEYKIVIDDENEPVRYLSCA